MMLKHLAIATRGATERARLLAQINAMDVAITIGGIEQDDTMVELVKPILRAALWAQIRGIEMDLVAIGVSITGG